MTFRHQHILMFISKNISSSRPKTMRFCNYILPPYLYKNYLGCFQKIIFEFKTELLN